MFAARRAQGLMARTACVVREQRRFLNLHEYQSKGLMEVRTTRTHTHSHALALTHTHTTPHHTTRNTASPSRSSRLRTTPRTLRRRQLRSVCSWEGAGAFCLQGCAAASSIASLLSFPPRRARDCPQGADPRRRPRQGHLFVGPQERCSSHQGVRL
jgi:hypothetical protein